MSAPTRTVPQRSACGGLPLLSVGYTIGMKTAISVPDDVFHEAERLARRLKRSRSDVYSRAVSEYVARHGPDRVTEAMDQAVAEAGEAGDDFAVIASRRVLRRSRW
jgi:predicted transcriptional regulator